MSLANGNERPMSERVRLELQSEGGSSSRVAFVKVFVDDELVAQVKAENDQEPGADMGLYQVIKLKQIPISEELKRFP